MAEFLPLTKAKLEALANRALASRSPDLLVRALVESVHKRDIEKIDQLLAAGADPNSLVNGFPALAYTGAMYSPKERGAEVVRRLLDAGADPKWPGLAASVAVEGIPMLAEAGADLSRFADGTGTMAHCLGLVEKPEAALALLRSGADPRVPGEDGCTPLMLAAERGHKKVFDELLKRGVDPLAVDKTGRSALRLAAEGAADCIPSRKSGCRAIVNVLRKQLPAQPEDIVLAAIVFDDVERLREMLASGMRPDTKIKGAPGRSGFMSIRQVVPEGTPEFLGLPLCIPDKADIDAVAGDSCLLMWAVRLDGVMCAATLIEAGADVNDKNASGISPADLSIGRSSEMRRVIGTYDVVPSRKYVRGERVFQPDLAFVRTLLHGTSGPSSRAARLGVHDPRALERLRSDANMTVPPVTKRSVCFADNEWEALAAAYVMEDIDRVAARTEKLISSADSYFLERDAARQHLVDPNEKPRFAKLPKVGHADSYPWPGQLPACMAAAALKGDTGRSHALAQFVTSDLRRTTRKDLSDNREYFEWALWQCLAPALRDESIPEGFAAAVREEPSPFGKRSKLLLDVTEALSRRDAKGASASFKVYVKYHDKNARYGVLPCPYSTILAMWGRRLGMNLVPSQQLQDQVVLPPNV